MREIPVYGTLAASDLFSDPFGRFSTRFDFKKLPKLVKGTWPEVLPTQLIASPTTRTDFEAYLLEALEQPELVCDTEYNPETKLMTHIGIAWKSGDTVRGCQLEWVRGRATKIERAIFMKYWRQICQKVPVAFWNAKADLPIIEHNLGTIPVKFEDPMQAHAVLWPDMDHDYEFVCSIYGRYPKLKHLSKENMLLYHWGDLIDLVWIWEDLKKELDHDKGCKRKYEEQNKKLIPIILNTEAAGIKINQERIATAIPEYERKSRDATILAGAYCGFPVNVGSVQMLTAYLLSGESVKLRGMDKDLLAQYRAKYCPFDAEEEKEGGFSIDYICRRVALGAHPLLELRTMYAKNEKVVSSYLRNLSSVRRIYPQINFHTQAGGRHSITKPALATLPPDLRDIIMPDTGQVWIGWDWDAQEPRIQWGESGSRVLEKAFTNGEDIHTTFVCDLYGWEKPCNIKDPHTSIFDAGWRRAHNWGGKDDPRRVFAKTTRYELNYDHSEKAYNAQQKAIRMGISAGIARMAAQTLLNSDPELRTWFKKIEEEGYKTRIARSWGGGRRVIYWADSMVKFPYNDVRNFPLQGGGADLYNITLVEMSEEVPEARFVYGMHDSQWYSVDATNWESVYPRIRTVAERPRLIGGRMIPFPGSFKMVNDKGEVSKL